METAARPAHHSDSAARPHTCPATRRRCPMCRRAGIRYGAAPRASLGTAPPRPR